MILRRKQKTEEDKAKARAKAQAKEREKRRKKMIRTKFGQKPLVHAKKGVYSCFYAVVVAVLLMLMIASAYVNEGDINILIGALGLGCLIMSVIGIDLGIRGLKERDKNYITCKVGIGANAVILLALVTIYIRGLL
jgi:hypothetical protein